MSLPARRPARRSALALACVSSLVLAIPAAPAAAQGLDAPAPDQPIYELRHLTGARSIGWIAEERGDTVVFRSIEGGEWRLDRRTAALRRARGRVERGEFWREDQNHSRLFFAPTGRALHAGQAYAGVFTVLPFVGYGVSEDVTLAGGFNPFGGELANMDLWIAPKVRVYTEGQTEAAVGGFYLQLPGGNPFDWDYDTYEPDRQAYRLAIGYGVATFGTLDQALHLGAGVAHAFGSDPGTRGIGMVGGEYRLGRKYKAISENWLLLPDYPMTSLGLRSIGERWTWDLGLMALLAEEGAPYIPIFSFSYAFGPGR
jgi:hypothetical protein